MRWKGKWGWNRIRERGRGRRVSVRMPYHSGLRAPKVQYAAAATGMDGKGKGECVCGAGSIIGKLAALVSSGNNVENLLPS